MTAALEGCHIPEDILRMVLHSGRSDFRLYVQNVTDDGILCVISPMPSVVGVQPVPFVIRTRKNA